MTLQAPPEPVVVTEGPPPPWSHAARVARTAHGHLPEPPVPRRRHPVRRTLLAVGAVLLLLFVAAVAYVWWPRPATPITEDQAVARFRDSGGAPAGQMVGAIQPGVYVYTAAGKEEVAIAGVPLPSRDIPGTVTLMVVPEGPCQRLTLNLMEQHTESTLYCRDADGHLLLVEQIKQELVAGVTTDGTTTCSSGDLGLPGDEPRAVHCLLHMTAAGTVIDVDLDGTARWEPGDAVAVGTEARATDRLVLDLAASGDMKGHMIDIQSIDPTTGLPLVIQRDILLDGPGRFAERTTLTVADLEPRR